MQTKCKLNNVELFFKLFCIQSKEIRNKKVRFLLNIDVRKEKEDSWVNAIKTKIAFVKGQLNFSSKSTTAANVDRMESLLDNWLKNITILP